MSELVFKRFSELDTSEVLTNTSNVILEDNGEVMRFPANGIGKVKTVNGVEPNENGNVEITIPEGFSGSWNDLEDKPFGEEALEITWDGNLDSIEHYAVILEDIVNGNGERYYACLVSDKTPTDEELCRLQYTDADYEIYGDKLVESGSNTMDLSEIPPEVLLNSDSGIKNHGDITTVMSDVIYIVRKDNVDYNGIVFPKAGMYVIRNERRYSNGSLYFVKEIKIPSVIKLDEKFIPNNIARMSDIPEGFSGSWNDLEDKPFGETEKQYIVAPRTMDENTSMRGDVVNIDNPSDGTTIKCKAVVNGVEKDCWIYIEYDSNFDDYVYNFHVGNGEIEDRFFVVTEDADCHFTSFTGTFEVYLPGEVKTLDPKYLPSGAVSSSTSVAHNPDDMSREEMIAFAKQLKSFWINESSDMYLCDHYKCKFIQGGSADECDPNCAVTVPDRYNLSADYNNKTAFNIEITKEEYDEIWAAWNAMMGKA